MNYTAFLKSKETTFACDGVEFCGHNPKLYDFQVAIVKWAVKKGRCAVFADCGMGKTLMQLDWCVNMPGRCIIAAPLAVAMQTTEEGKRNGYDIEYSRGGEPKTHITVTNYEMLDKFNPQVFDAIVLDESSILKNFNGKFKQYICDNWRIKYRLCATATPAPNDYEELGNHSEFLGVMSRTEMLSEFFLHDSGDTSKWRLKKHAENEYWKWLASWGVYVRHPSDIGFACDEERLVLPKCEINHIVVDSDPGEDGYLFAMEAQSLSERRDARKNSLSKRVKAACDIVKSSNEQHILWCDLNCESDALSEVVPESCNVQGSDSLDSKCSKLIDFANGKIRNLISKPSICGFGMNFQNCHNMIFVGLSDSYEQFYQAVRRCWRFMQKNCVKVTIITSSAESAVVRNIKRKEEDAQIMAKNMSAHMANFCRREIYGTRRVTNDYKPSLKFMSPKFERVG